MAGSLSIAEILIFIYYRIAQQKYHLRHRRHIIICVLSVILEDKNFSNTKSNFIVILRIICK